MLGTLPSQVKVPEVILLAGILAVENVPEVILLVDRLAILEATKSPVVILDAFKFGTWCASIIPFVKLQILIQTKNIFNEKTISEITKN